MPLGMSDLGAIALMRPEPDCFVISCSADAANDAIVLWGRGSNSDRMIITRQRENEVFATVETAARNWPHRVFIQPLTLGNILLVSPRVISRDGRNAVVIDSDGISVLEGTLGDGIEHVQTTTSGDIWVGYFDEGVFGGEGTLGSGGIVKFDSKLRRLWDYNSGDPSGLQKGNEPVSDCYSLNVTDVATFACTYMYFPIIEIDASGSRQRMTGASGVQHILVNGTRAALLGGFEDDPHRVSIGTLRPDQFFERQSAEWPVSIYPAMNSRPSVVTRGAQLNVFDSRTWFRYQLD